MSAMEQAVKLKEAVKLKDQQIHHLQEKVRLLTHLLEEETGVPGADPYDTHLPLSKKQQEKAILEEEKINAMIEVAFKQNHAEELQERVKHKEESQSNQAQRMQQQQKFMFAIQRLKKKNMMMRAKLEGAEHSIMCHEDHVHALLEKFNAQLSELDVKHKRAFQAFQAQDQAMSSKKEETAPAMEKVDRLEIPFGDGLETTRETAMFLLKHEESSAYKDLLRSTKQELFFKLSGWRMSNGGNLKDIYVAHSTRGLPRTAMIHLLKDGIAASNHHGLDIIQVWANFMRKLSLEEAKYMKRFQEKKTMCDAETTASIPDLAHIATVEKHQSQLASTKVELELQRTESISWQMKHTTSQTNGSRFYEMLVSVLKLLQKETRFCGEVDTNTITGDMEKNIAKASSVVAKLTSYYLRPKDTVLETQAKAKAKSRLLPWEVKQEGPANKMMMAIPTGLKVISRLKQGIKGSGSPRSGSRPASPDHGNNTRAPGSPRRSSQFGAKDDSDHDLDHDPDADRTEIADIASAFLLAASGRVDPETPDEQSAPTSPVQIGSPMGRHPSIFPPSRQFSVCPEKAEEDDALVDLSDIPIIPGDTAAPLRSKRKPTKGVVTPKERKLNMTTPPTNANNEKETEEEAPQSPPPPPPPPSISMRIHRLGPQAAVLGVRRGLASAVSGSVVRPYTVGAPHPETVAAYSEGVGLVVAQGSALKALAKKKV